MTETKSPAAPASEIQVVDLPNLLATLFTYTQPAGQALDAAIRANADGDDPDAHKRAIIETSHFDAISAWCAENPQLAARIVLATLYLASGRYTAQVAKAPPAPEGQPAPEPAEETPPEAPEAG